MLMQIEIVLKKKYLTAMASFKLPHILHRFLQASLFITSNLLVILRGRCSIWPSKHDNLSLLLPTNQTTTDNFVHFRRYRGRLQGILSFKKGSSFKNSELCCLVLTFDPITNHNNHFSIHSIVV